MLMHSNQNKVKLMNKYNVKGPRNEKVVELCIKKAKLIQRVIKMIDARYDKKIKEVENAG